MGFWGQIPFDKLHGMLSPRLNHLLQLQVPWDAYNSRLCHLKLYCLKPQASYNATKSTFLKTTLQVDRYRGTPGDTSHLGQWYGRSDDHGFQQCRERARSSRSPGHWRLDAAYPQVQRSQERATPVPATGGREVRRPLTSESHVPQPHAPQLARRS